MLNFILRIVQKWKVTQWNRGMNVPDDFEINNTKNKTKMADVRMQTIDHLPTYI